MTGLAFTFAGAALVARGSGALWWPRHRALIVADLHLGKSARMARRGGVLLPPFETRDTLARLAAEVAALDPVRVILLGDSFDDDAARSELEPDEQAMLAALAHGRDWIAIAGNHDPGAAEADRALPEILLDGIALRHEAALDPRQGPDISGHFHPKVTLAGQRRPAFLIGAAHLILPAFGTYTGGLDAGAAPLRDLVGQGHAILTGARPHLVPLRPDGRAAQGSLRPGSDAALR